MTAAPFLLGAYLLGAFPTSCLVARFRGVDLAERGSGNLGATNVYRHLGAGPAGLVVAVDVAKGFAPAWFFPLWDGVASPYWALGYGLAAIAGHIWSVFTRFRGGKGVATAAGALAALAPLAVLIGLLVWTGLVLITRIVSVASLVAAALVPAVAWVAAAPSATVLFAVGLAAIVFWTHRRNIGRLLRREELRLARGAGSGPDREARSRGSGGGPTRPEGPTGDDGHDGPTGKVPG